MKDASYGAAYSKPEWGCSFHQVDATSGPKNIYLCHVKVSDIIKIADELTNIVMNDSWIMNLDKGARRAYETTVKETAECLVDIFRNNLRSGTDDKVSTEFGEVMVSMSSSRALEVILGHTSLPIAELWKPQKKQNEGFDFHTVCPSKFINFGEAKFSGSGNPHGLASSQAHSFFDSKKHLRDRVHLINLVEKESLDNLDADSFGAVLAFSINSNNPLTIFENAITTAQSHASLKNAKYIYIVGVSHEH